MGRHFPDSMTILSPTAILGYGFPPESLARGLARRPDVIAVDAGSTDPGPYYLGAGKSFTSRDGVRRDLELLLEAALERRIPLIVGSAGGSGARPHLDWTLAILREITARRRFSFPMAAIPADVAADTVRSSLRAGTLMPLPGAPDLTEADLDGTVRIVAQMGMEPIIEALKKGNQVIVCGRAYDPAVFAAPAVLAGHDAGLALHMGKILECAAIAALPGSGSDCVLGTLSGEHFELETLNPERRFTPFSVAAHALYEKADPYWLQGPGGAVDLSGVEYEALAEGRVRVRGSRYRPDESYRVKLEGVRHAGFRTISIAGVRAPRFIEQIDSILDLVREQVLETAPTGCQVLFHVYGRNGVMEKAEPIIRPAHEIGLVIEAVANDQTAADEVCALVRSRLLHHGYPGRVSTAGNLAFPYSPSDISYGEVFEFSVYHLMPVADGGALFPAQDGPRGS